MRIDVKSADLCCLPGPSSIIIRNLATLSAPFDRDGAVLRAGSVLEAAEIVAECVPDPYMGRILECVPSDVAHRAVAGVSGESRALANMAFGAEVETVMEPLMAKRCPWAFIMSREVSSVSIDIERIAVLSGPRGGGDGLYHIFRIAPGDNAWSVWDTCERAWGNRNAWGEPALTEALDRDICTLFRPSMVAEGRGAFNVSLDLFAWSIEVAGI